MSHHLAHASATWKKETQNFSVWRKQGNQQKDLKCVVPILQVFLVLPRRILFWCNPQKTNYLVANLLVLSAQFIDQENSFQTTYKKEVQKLHIAWNAVFHNGPTEKQWATLSCQAYSNSICCFLCIIKLYIPKTTGSQQCNDGSKQIIKK